MSAENTKKSLDKRMSLKEAISMFVTDGCSLAFSGMGGQQVVAPTYEIVRQGRKHLTLMGDSPCECGDYLIGTGQVDRVEVAFIAFAVAGVSPNYRRATEKGDTSQAGCLRILKLHNGIAVLCRIHGHPVHADEVADGSSLEEYNQMIKVMDDPYGGGKVALVPAAIPDVAIVHVNRADKLGNAQYLGFGSNADVIARAAKHTIITCEEIVSTETISKIPTLTTVPQYAVDAVVEIPYGCHPWNMSYAYVYDLPFHMEMMAGIDTEDGFKKWMDEWAFGCQDHEQYCEKVGWGRLKAHAV